MLATDIEADVELEAWLRGEFEAPCEAPRCGWATDVATHAITWPAHGECPRLRRLYCEPCATRFSAKGGWHQACGARDLDVQVLTRL